MQLISSVFARNATFVYVGNSGSQNITVLELEPSGALRVIETVDLPQRATSGSSLPLASSPDQRYLFAALRAAPHGVATFRRDAETGRLTYAGSGRLAASMTYISTDRSGRFLFGASYDASLATVSSIGPDGVVGDVVQQLQSAPHAHCIVAAPSNRFVLHTSLGGDAVYQHRFDAQTGTLTPNEPSTVSVEPGAGPRHLVFSPAGDVVYLLNELDGSLYVFPFDTRSGTLTPPTQIESALPDGFSGKPWAADLHITPDGRFLYASERTSSTLAAFRVDVERWMLTRIGTYPTPTQPRVIAIDPYGEYLVVAGERSHVVTSYAIGLRTGALVQRAETRVGQTPNWIEIVASAPDAPVARDIGAR